MSVAGQVVLAGLLVLLVVVLAILLASAREVDTERRRDGTRTGESPAARLRDVDYDESDLYR
jgi:hypothetical protein